MSDISNGEDVTFLMGFYRLDSHNLYYGTKCSDLGAGAESALSCGPHSRLALSDAA